MIRSARLEGQTPWAEGSGVEEEALDKEGDGGMVAEEDMGKGKDEGDMAGTDMDNRDRERVVDIAEEDMGGEGTDNKHNRISNHCSIVKEAKRSNIGWNMRDSLHALAPLIS